MTAAVATDPTSLFSLQGITDLLNTSGVAVAINNATTPQPSQPAPAATSMLPTGLAAYSTELLMLAGALAAYLVFKKK